MVIGVNGLVTVQCRTGEPCDRVYSVMVSPTCTKRSLAFAASASTLPPACRATSGAEFPVTTETTLPWE